MFLNIPCHFREPNDDYLQMEILAPDRGIVSPVRFWYPQYDFPNRGSRFGNPGECEFSYPQYVSWGFFSPGCYSILVHGEANALWVAVTLIGSEVDVFRSSREVLAGGSAAILA